MKKFLKENGLFILIIITILVVRFFIVTPVRVSGDSMYDTLYDGDILILNKLDDIKRDKIVVVSRKVSGSRLIKRVIALPGETISCKDHVIYINGEIYKDVYAYGLTNDFDEITLKSDEYFVMGDNRKVSLDSRSFGPINSKYISGTTSFVLFPFSHFGKVK